MHLKIVQVINITPNTINSIGANAFAGCSGLTKVIIPFLGDSRAAALVKQNLVIYLELLLIQTVIQQMVMKYLVV